MRISRINSCILKIKNISCIKSLQGLLNVNFDTECEMLGPRIKNSLKINFWLNNFWQQQLQHNNIQCGHFTVHYLTLMLTEKLEIQTYLCFALRKNLGSYLTKLRVSAYQLCVEIGRYCNPAIPSYRENRFCFHCKNIAEDEKHYFFNWLSSV